MDSKRHLRSLRTPWRLSLLLGFFVSIAAAVVLSSIAWEDSVWEDLYLSILIPPLRGLAMLILPRFAFVTVTPTCVSLPAILCASFTWAFLLSILLYGFLARRYWFVLLAAVIWIPFLFNALVVLSLHMAPFYGRDFDQAIWVQNHETDKWENPRGKMAKSLQTRLIREKPTKAEAIALLGKPDFMSEADKRRPDFLSYTLGRWSGLRIDYDSLDIHFDASDRVCRVCIVQH